MADRPTTKSEKTPGHPDLAKAAEEAPNNFIAEFWEFARHNKKWWLTPIIIVLLLVGLLVLITGTGAGALIYPLF